MATRQKFIITIMFVFLFILNFSIQAKKILITGFEPDDNIKLNSWLNCKYEIITAKANENIPQGKHYLKITLGGITSDTGGGLTVFLPKEKNPDTITKITMWIKGSFSIHLGPVIILSDGFGKDWCWMGKRFEAKSQLRLDDEDWEKFEFNIKDFVPTHKRMRKKSPAFKDIKYIVICLGKRKTYPDSIVFYIDKIELLEE